MRDLLKFWNSAKPARRQSKSRRLGEVLESCEERTLLSGVAIYPAEAAAVAAETSAKKVDPAAVPPAVYNGGWVVSSNLGGGTLAIQQFGNKFEGSMLLGVTSIDVFKGKINGLNAKAKTRGFVNGVKVAGKFNVTQFNFGLNFNGSISAKGGPFGGGQTGTFSGAKVV